MSQHRGHLVFIFCQGKYTSVKTHDTPGHGKGVHGRVVNNHQFKPGVFEIRIGGQVVQQLLKILLHQRIVVLAHPAAKCL